jgi:glycolate oxidase iron-sulfur subunit
MLRDEEGYAERAATISNLTRDIAEYLSDHDLGPPKRWSSLRVAYHSACSMQHGQRITDEPKELLRKAGYTVLDVPEGHICCGSAGTYNILQPELAGQLRERKVANIQSTRPDLIAAGNIGCISQIGGGTDLPIAHTVELLDWAYGGPVPRGLEALKPFVKDVDAPKPVVEDFISA